MKKKAISRGGVWSFEDAEENFDELLDLAETEGPQKIIRGEDSVYMISAADWKRAGLGELPQKNSNRRRSEVSIDKRKAGHGAKAPG